MLLIVAGEVAHLASTAGLERTTGESAGPCFASLELKKQWSKWFWKLANPLESRPRCKFSTRRGKEQDQKRRRLELALERVRYEAERAQRQYDAVDPANRLVAAELEARWNAALAQVAEAEARLESEGTIQDIVERRSNAIACLMGAQFACRIDDVSAPIELKERIIRTLINEIVVDINQRQCSGRDADPLGRRCAYGIEGPQE